MSSVLILNLSWLTLELSPFNLQDLLPKMWFYKTISANSKKSLDKLILIFFT